MPPSEKDTPRLTLDADVHVPAAKALRLRGFDVVSVWELGQEALSDEEQLQRASDQGRCIVTFNVTDFCVSMQRAVMPSEVEASLFGRQRREIPRLRFATLGMTPFL